MSLLLAADIGGTQSRILVKNADGQTLLRQDFASAEHAQLESLLQQVIKRTGAINSACLAVAGPVRQYEGGQQAQVTNLPWHLDSNTLKTALKINELSIINDFEAIGHGLEELTGDDLLVLQAGQPQEHSVRALIGAGTGLGQALLLPQSQGYRVHATEGGHVDFAPTSALQQELLQWLMAQHAHVSVERVVSGPGLVSIFRFLAEREQWSPEQLQAVLGQGDDAANISRLAAEQHPLAQQTLELFVEVYGAQTGNLALGVLPYSGLYIAGGIAGKILPQINRGGFMQAFLHKGRMSELLRAIPVRVVLNQDVGLLGALKLAKHNQTIA